MNSHPESSELQAFRERRLPAAAMLRVDQHLAGCPGCRAQLAGHTDARHGRAAIRAVVQAGAHLSYEQLRDHVDGRLAAAQRAAVDAHVALCTMCRSELADLALHAPALRQPLATPVAAAAAEPAWRRWFSFAPALAVAGIVGAVALTVVVQDQRGSAPSDSKRSIPGQADLNHAALDGLAPVSPTAAEAWRTRDLARLVPMLQALVDQRQPLAMSALASLHAQGLGVAKDMQQAEQLWQRAAALGEPIAKDNLERLGRR